MQEKGVTGMKTLSDSANLESSTVRKFLDGSSRSIKVETLYKLSLALNVQPVELLPLEWQKPSDIDTIILESAITDILTADQQNKTKSTPSQMAGDIADLYKTKIKKNLKSINNESIK